MRLLLAAIISALQEIQLLAHVSGFEVVGVHGDLDLEVGMEGEGAYKCVVCMVKKT